MKVYFILDKEELTQNLIDYALQTSPFTVRESIDGSKVLLKFNEDNIPLELYTVGATQLNKSEMQAIVETEDWQLEPSE